MRLTRPARLPIIIGRSLVRRADRAAITPLIRGSRTAAATSTTPIPGGSHADRSRAAVASRWPSPSSLVGAGDPASLSDLPGMPIPLHGRDARAHRRCSAGAPSRPSSVPSTTARPPRALAVPRPAGPGGVAVLAGITVTYISNPFGPGQHPVQRAVGIAFTVVWIVGMINSLNFIDGLDGLSSGIALIAAVTLGLISPDDRGRPAARRRAVLRARGLAARVPALELPPGRDLHRHRRRDVPGLHAGGALDPRLGQGHRRAAGPGRADHRHVLGHRPPRAPGARRSRPTAATSTTACSTSG